jgi:hypothetical protein
MADGGGAGDTGSAGPVSGGEDFNTIMDGKRAETQAEIHAMGPGRLRYRIILVAMVAAILGWVGYLIALSAF